ncbi:MAG: MFS transporter [Sporolactobacillus sp.]
MKTEIVTSNQKISGIVKPFGIRDKIGYMFGDVGNCFILGLVNGFLMIYYTNVLGISGAIVGITFLIAKIFDAFIDVGVGHLADISKLSSEGRFRPWIRKMRYPFLFASILLFIPLVNHFSMYGKIGYIFITYILYNVFLSTVNIPYGALASAISSDSNERASLSTFRSVGSAVAGTATGFAIPIFMYGANDAGKQIISGNHFFLIALGCAVLAYISYEFTYKLTYERVRVEKTGQVKMKKLIKGLFTDRALLALVVADMFIVINQILATTNLTYLFNDYFHDKLAMSVAVSFNFISVILMAPFATFFSRKFGKKESSVVTLLGASVIYFIMFTFHLHNQWVFLALLFFGTIGASYFNLMVWAFITDVIDYHQTITGLREDGTVYGVNSFSRKIGQALAGGISGFMLSLIGYQSSSAGGVLQTAVVSNRIYMLATLIPVVCLLIAMLILAFWYPLNKMKIQETEHILKKD